MESQFRWFHGSISRDEAERLLRTLDQGSFLIRSSIHYPGDYTLTLRGPADVQHYRIISNEKENVYTIDEEIYFRDLKELVAHYKIDSDGLITSLTMPVSNSLFSTISPGPGFISGFPNNGTAAGVMISDKDIPKEFRIQDKDIQLGEELGRGNFGAVNVGFWQGKKVAVKTLQDPQATKSFLAEAKLMMRLNHKYLVNLIGVSTKYIVLEYMAKGNLRDYLRTRGRAVITHKVHLKFALDIVMGMCYLEKQSFVHRDLAARNILISETDTAKVSDFGMARDDRTQLEGGTIPVKWTAPEAIKEKKFTNKSDVWSYGVLLWEMYSFGKVPYPRIPADEVMTFLEEGNRMPAPQDCPSSIYNIMGNCWKWKPSERPSFSKLEKDLHEISRENIPLPTLHSNSSEKPIF